MTCRLLAGAALGLAFLSADAAPASSAELFADAEVGGGYDGNLDAAPNARDGEGDGFGFATAGVGVTGTNAGRLRGELSGRWTGVLYHAYSDLSVQRLSLPMAVRLRVSEGVTLHLSPSVGGSFHGDSDRDSLDLGLGLGARLTPAGPLWLEPGYLLRRRDAKTSTFDRTTHRFALGIGVEPWQHGFLRVTPAFELGPVVRYEPSAEGGGGGGGASGRGRPNDTFGSNWTADREDAAIGEIGWVLEQALTARTFVALGGSYARVWADSSDYDLYSMNASIGLRWP